MSDEPFSDQFKALIDRALKAKAEKKKEDIEKEEADKNAGKTPSPIKEINRQNAAFWETMAKRFEARVAKRPEDFKAAVARFEREQRVGVKVFDQLSVEHYVEELAKTEDRHKIERNSERGKIPKTPRANPIHEFIDHGLARGLAPKDIIAGLKLKAEKDAFNSLIDISEDGQEFIVREDHQIKFRLAISSAGSTISQRKNKPRKKILSNPA